jgi:glycosyltransferase involved in cell wall biosynthesis
MTRIVVNAECARNGGTRSHLRAILAAAPPGTFVPVFRTEDATGWSTEEPATGQPDGPLPLVERIRWERTTLPAALRELRPTVLLQPSNIGLLRDPGVPTVQVVHNVAPFVRPISQVARGKLAVRLLILRALTRRALRRAAAVVLLSETAKELLGREIRGRTEVIRPGLDPAEPVPPGDRGSDVVVVAHLFRYKRVEDAVEAFAAAGDATGGRRLVIYGGHYDAPYVAEIRATIDRLGIRDRVDLVGARTGSEVRAAMRAAAVVLQPSACENAPQVVYECLTDATPIVCSDIAAHRELVDGAHPAVGDVPAWGRALAAALDDPRPPVAAAALGSWADSARAIAEVCRAVG